MNVIFSRIDSPTYSGEIKNILSSLEEGIFDLQDVEEGDPLGMQWWKLEVDGEVAGLGWIDIDNKECEISIAVKKKYRKSHDIKVGKLLIENLEIEIIENRLGESIIAVVKKTNPYIKRVVFMLLDMDYKFCNTVGMIFSEQNPTIFIEDPNNNIYLCKLIQVVK